LSSDGTSASNSSAIFSRAAVDNGVDCDLNGVLIGHDVDLKNEVLALNSFVVKSHFLGK
jgi:hypothetical protein